MRLAVGNGAVEIIDAIAGDFVSDALLPRITFIEADPGNFGFGKGGPRGRPVTGRVAF